MGEGVEWWSWVEEVVTRCVDSGGGISLSGIVSKDLKWLEFVREKVFYCCVLLLVLLLFYLA